jgi:tetratricopeptide (TPR) repeat protein
MLNGMKKSYGHLPLIHTGSAAGRWSFRYSTDVFPLSFTSRACAALSVLLCTGCAENRSRTDAANASQTFYTVTAEIALNRHEPRTAALQYAAAADRDSDPELLKRALDVAMATSQPSLAEHVAVRWTRLDPRSVAAHRAAARAALILDRVAESAAHYRVLLDRSPENLAAEFAELQNDLITSDNVFGARQVADLIGAAYPDSGTALRICGLTALRADDPAAAVRSLTRALAQDAPERESIAQALARARILAGDVDEPLQQGAARLEQHATAADRFDYAVLLMTAQREAQAAEQLEILSHDAALEPAALRFLGLLEFQQGDLDAAAGRFRGLVHTGKLTDDGYYYLGLIADRHADAEGALHLYSQVKSGDNVMPAMLHAAGLLYKHGAAPAAEELLDQLSDDVPQRAPEVIAARARLYQDAGEFERALDTLSRGCGEYPDDVELQYAQVSVLEDQGRVDAAVGVLRTLLKERPDDPAAMNALGFTLADHGRSLAHARRLVARAYAEAPHNYAILDSMGWVEFRRGNAAAALPYLQRAYAGDRSGDIAAHLADVLWQLGRTAEAERLLVDASVIDGDNKLLKATRRRLHAG